MCTFQNDDMESDATLGFYMTDDDLIQVSWMEIDHWTDQMAR